MIKIIQSIKYLLLLIALLVIASCAQQYQTAGDQIHQTMRESIEENQVNPKKRDDNIYIPDVLDQALTQPVSTRTSRTSLASRGSRFDIDADNVLAKSFFMGLMKDTKSNMIVRVPETDKITLHLKNVTIDETLAAAEDAYGYQFKRTSYGYEVLPPELTTQTFHVNYLAIKRKGRSQMHLASSQISEKVGSSAGGASATVAPSGAGADLQLNGSGAIVETRTDSDFWKNLDETLKVMVPQTDGRSVSVNPQAGVIVIRAFQHELNNVAIYLKRIQSSLERQVIIEAKILEVRLNDDFQSGINWTMLGLSQAGADFLPPGPQPITTWHASAGHGDFTMLISLLEQQGNVQVLSSPRISTVNNQQAVIKVGSDQFFVTGVTSNVVPTGTSATTSQSVDLTPFFSGITLDVTPEINRNGDIVLHIHPSISDVQDQTKTVDFGSGGTLTLPLAKSTIRESDSIVHARDRQVIVIGGLMGNATSETLSNTPVLSKIPFVGTFFRTTAQVSVKTELVILLRPVLANDNGWQDDLRRTEDRFNTLERGFHVGSRSEVFGTKGEHETYGKTRVAVSTETDTHIYK